MNLLQHYYYTKRFIDSSSGNEKDVKRTFITFYCWNLIHLGNSNVYDKQLVLGCNLVYKYIAYGYLWGRK